ncbi:helix-turn-helix domain-containing protein [Frateuria defendens]|uniref:helix-turn-helix domain-containing protein n=1 Tax=Frateuria defendens TaxID=2219559 RepID=UPI00066FC037|nr:helix-turn-helix transcriptional regulator [Frateuria defendens]
MDLSPYKTSPEAAAGGGSFSDRIRLLIQRVGSATEIARLCGFSEGVVRSWRDGNTDPSRARCLKLARTLGISLVWLVAGEGSMLQRDLDTGADETGSELVTTSRLRSSGRTGETAAAASFTTSGGVAGMDPDRLSAAMRILQSELELAGSPLPLAESSDLLSELYEILGPGNQVDAIAMLRFNQRLAERIGRSQAA